VAAVSERDFQVSVIPHTGSETTLLGKKVGDKVNLENDIIGKYVQKMLYPKQTPLKKESKITMEFLAEHGF
ncbi:MAG: riboflavin synthase, partial [Clostridia bacterium]|nr:riboflavin synthase [Clostridia bacterium]